MNADDVKAGQEYTCPTVYGPGGRRESGGRWRVTVIEHDGTDAAVRTDGGHVCLVPVDELEPVPPTLEQALLETIEGFGPHRAPAYEARRIADALRAAGLVSEAK